VRLYVGRRKVSVAGVGAALMRLGINEAKAAEVMKRYAGVWEHKPTRPAFLS